MSSRILYALCKGLQAELEHLTRDDLESFLFVLAYGIKRHSIECTPKKDRKALHAEFVKSYGQLTIDQIYKDRRGLNALNISAFKCGVSDRIQQWFRAMTERFIHAEGYSSDSGTNMTHSQLIALLDEGLAYLQ